MCDSFSFKAIGRINACYREKFGIPRQPGLVKVPATIDIFPDYAREEAFRGLQDFSHIWVSFVFHASMDQGWKPTVRPPRLGGNERVGVFASRSMFRPNPLGLSVVELSAINIGDRGVQLDIIGGDFLHGTPVLDIKPYLPYVDAVPGATGGYAPQPPEAGLQVCFADHLAALFQRHAEDLPQLQQVIREILQYDARPAYQSRQADARQYSMRLYDFDVKWCIDGAQVLVSDIVEL